MGRVRNMVEVDGQKLQDELKKRGMNLTEASLDMGRSPCYLANVKRDGRTTETTLKLLEANYNIKREDIELAWEPPTKTEAPAEEPKVEVDMAALQKCITEAVKEAFIWYANM